MKLIGALLAIKAGMYLKQKKARVYRMEISNEVLIYRIRPPPLTGYVRLVSSLFSLTY